MTFNFKQKSQDFYVTENLPFELDGEGDALYVYIEKRNLSTGDIIDHLRSKFGLSRMSIGIAGLKDKKAVAKQRISIYDRALNKIGGERVFVGALMDVAKVLKTTRHAFPLNMSTPITNTFHIRLRSTKKLSQDEKEQARVVVQGLVDEGYPNKFGEQRFGIEGRNSRQGSALYNGTSKQKFKKYEAIFKLQAFASKLFNDYIDLRTRQHGMEILDGDILTRRQGRYLQYGVYDEAHSRVEVCEIKGKHEKQTKSSETYGKGKKGGKHGKRGGLGAKKEAFFTIIRTGEVVTYDTITMLPTGPIPGHNMPICDPASEAGQFEQSFLARHQIIPKKMGVFEEYRVYGLRRALWVQPSKTNVRYQADDLLVDFTLPAGSYASILVDGLMGEIG